MSESRGRSKSGRTFDDINFTMVGPVGSDSPEGRPGRGLSKSNYQNKREPITI